jgi:hypothetical protein
VDHPFVRNRVKSDEIDDEPGQHADQTACEILRLWGTEVEHEEGESDREHAVDQEYEALQVHDSRVSDTLLFCSIQLSAPHLKKSAFFTVFFSSKTMGTPSEDQSGPDETFMVWMWVWG